MYLKSIKVLEKVQMQRSIVNSLYSVDFRVASHADALLGLCHAFLFLKEALTTSALETYSRSAINSGNFYPMESGILRFGIQNTAKELESH